MGSIDAPDWLKDKMKNNISSKNSGGDLNVMPAPDFFKKKDEAGNVLNGSSASELETPSISLNDQFLNWNGRNKKGQLLANFKNDPNWKPAPEQVKPVGSKPAEKSIFDLPDNVIFTPNLLDSQELEEYNQKAASTPIPQLPNKTQIVKDIIASRQNDAVMRERAKKFLVNDAAKMDLKVDAENFPKVEEYFNDKKNIVQNEIQGLLGDLEDLGVAWGENLYLNPDAQKKMKRISELDGYLGELKKYSNIFIREQAVRDIKPTDYDNYSDYLKAIGRKVNSVNNYEGIKKKEEAILNKTDDTRSKQITDNENYNFELAGIEALQDNIIANFKAGNIDEEAARSEMSKLYISNQTLESRYPEAALDNLRKYLGDYIAQKRKDNDGNLKQTWHNVIYAAPSSKEIITAIHDLRANDQVEISEEQEKLLAADPDKIPLTSMLGHIYKNTILKGAQTLNSMVGIDNEERKLEFRDPTMYLPVQPGEIPMPVAVGEKNIVRMQPNPAAGQHADVLSWATANSVSDVAGTIASYVGLNKVFGVVANKLLGGLAGAETTGMAVTAAGELKPITALTAAQTNLASNILSSTYLNYYDKLEASKDLTDNTTAQKAYALSSSIITGLVFAEINPGKILSGITGAEEKAMGQKFIDKLMQGKGNIEPEKMKSFFAEWAMNTAKDLGHNMSLVKANQIADIALDKLTNKNALENRDVMDEMFGSLPADIISFLPFSAVAGYKQAKGNIGIRNAIRMAMTDPVRFENDMLTNVQTGKISPEDAAQKMAYVKGLLKVYRGNDLNTEKLLSLTPEQRFEYANNLLEENGINHKIKGMTDDLQIAAEREKIAVLQERRKTLLNGQQEPAGTNATNTPGESIQSPGSQATKSETTESVQQTPETPESKVAKDLLTTDKPVFTDFDGTVFKDGKLTPIGEELKAKIARGEDVTVLTARKGTEENLNFISEQLGISKEKIKAGLSPEGKASHLTPDAVFIDNDAKNRQAAEKVGIKAIDPNMRMVDAATPDEITIGEMVDRTGTYKGERGHFFQDGQSVVFKVDGKNKEYELGNIEEVKNEPISSFGIVNEQSVVNVNDAGNVEVRGKEYVNHFSDPVAAINYDKEGNIQSVNLETTDGKKRTFRGNIAEDIAYQIHLQKITKDNETATKFEEYINTPDVAKTINERLPEVAQEGPTGDNGEVQPAERTKIEPLSAEELFEQRKLEGKLGVFKDMPAEEGVKMIAEQAQDIDSKGVQGNRIQEAYDATVSRFGEPLVKAAIEKYPAPEAQPEQIIQPIELSVETEQQPESKIKSAWQRGVEALIHPGTGLAAVTKKILDEQQPLKDAFLKRIGLSIEDYRKLDDAGKEKIQKQWVKSKEFEQLQKGKDVVVDEGVVEKTPDMTDIELSKAIGNNDVFKQVQKSENQLGEGVVNRRRLIETAKRIQNVDKKDKLLPAHIFEALQYETAYENKFDDLRKAGDAESIQRMIDVGIDLPKDISDKFRKANYDIKVEKGDYGIQSYDLKSDMGKVSGHIGEAYDWKNNKKVEGKEISVARIDAKEIGKGQGEELLKSVIDYANKNDIKYIGSTSLNEASRKTFEKLEKQGLINPALEGVNNKTITWEIIKDQSLSTQKSKPEISNNPVKAKPISDKVKGRFEKLKNKSSETKSTIEQATAVKAIEDKAEDAANTGNQTAAEEVIKEIDTILHQTPEQQARDAGEKTVDDIVYKRQDPLQDVVMGNEVDILFTKDDKEPANYAVIEASELQPSHKSGIKNEMHFIPEAQPRDRGGMEILKNEAKLKADNLDPNQLADNNIAYFGAPIVNERGEVIQGNGRAEAVDYYYNNDVKDSRGYKDMILNKAEDLGLDRQKVEAMDKPVLVKMTKANDERAIELGNYTSSELEDVKQKNADVKAAFNRLTPAKVQELSSTINSKIDETTTLKQIIRDNSKVILDKLFDLGALRADNKERYINKEGQVTAEGVQASYDVVRQLLFEGGASDLQAKFDNLPFNVREAIEKTIPAILSNPELKARVQESIEIMREQQESGTADFASWKVQQEIFGDQLTPVEKYDKSVLDFAQGMMESKTQKGIAERIVKLSKEMNGTPADMFAEAVPEKRFEDAYDQEGIRFAIQEEAGSDLKQMKDIVRDIQNEYAEKDEQITLDDIKAIAKKELGSDYNEQLVEDAYNEAGKENRMYKKATAIKNEIAKRVEEFTGQEVTVMPNSESLIKKAKELGANKFQNENAVFETRDGKPIGFNYDTDQVARERFDIQKLEKIGAGSDRTVFDLGDGKVLKVAHTARGLEQNIHEGDYYLQGIVPTVHERGLNYVVADNIPRMKASDMVKTYDVETGDETGTARAADMIKELQTLSARDYEIHTDKAQNILGKYGLGDVLNYNILAGDFSAMRNWGYKDGVPYHIDGGTFGGIDMITSHRGKTPLSNPEFREIYNKSRQLKKQYGDSDKYTKFMRSPDGEVLGFTHDGKIYLNGERLNPNTIVHEAGHIWTEVAMTQMPAVYKRGIELVNGSNYMKRVVSNQFYQKEALKLPKAQRKAYFEHEALAQAIGDKGAQFVTEARRKSFLDWATELWNRVAKIAGFKNVTAKELQDMTLEEFAKRSAGEILKGSQKDMVAEPVEETTTEKKKPSAEGSVLLSHSGLQDIADDFGLSDVTSRDHKSDEKLAEEAATLSRQWHDEGTYAENIDRLINNIFSGRGSNDVEKTILQQHIANVRAEASKLDVYSKAYDEKLKELERLKNAGAALKSTAAATLRDTTVFSDADPTMADWMAERKTVLEVDELTNGQKKEIQDIWNEYETNLKTADEKVYQAEQLIDQLKAELAVKNARGQRKYLRSKNLESLKAERGKIVSSIQDKLKKIRGESNVTVVPYAKELFAIAPDVSKLVTNLIDTGVTKLSDIVDNIHATLVDSIPGITKRDVHNLVAGDYNQKKPTLTELQFLKKDIIEQAKLMNKLEKLQNGEPVGTEKQQRTRIKEITDLRNQIKEYRKYDQSSRTPEQILNAIKKRNEARQKEIEEKIANKDFSTQPKKPPLDQNKLLKQANPELWKETMDAIMAKEEAGHKFELLKRKDELEKRPPLKKYVVDPVGKVITTAKAIKAGIDDSVTMVQLMMAVYSNPGAGLKAKLEAFKDINNTRFKRQLAALHNSVYWDLIKKSELDITEPQSFGKKEVEELFSGNLLDDKFRIPFTDKKVNPWTYTGGMFERIFTSMGNNLRLNLFYKRIAMLEAQGKTFESHPEEYKGAARAINELTARGKMPKNIQASMDAISPIIWAPKMLASTFNTLGITDVAAAFRGKKGVYRSIPPQQARYLAWQMGKGIGLGIGVMAALAMRGWGVDKDPRSNTFGNVTSPDGNTKYNVFGRFSSLVKNIVQIGWGTRVESSGTVTDIDKTMGGRLQSLYKFTRGKMTPAAGLFSDYWLNKKVNTFTKQPISLEPGALAKDMLLPISLTDVKSSLEQDGSIALLTRFLPALEGIQVTDRRDYKTISSSLPDRAKKYLSDRNIAEPFFNPKQIEIKQMKKGVGEMKKLSDFDEETQKKYEKTHSRIFDQELARLKSSFVFKDEYGNISLNSDNSKDKKVWVKDLDEKGMKKFIGIINGKATEKTKELLFKEYKK